MKVLGVIPARYDSSRFPGKPLIDLDGTSMIMRVYQQCKKASRLDEVIVATDDERIFSHVVHHHGRVCMTKADHRSGTERVQEVAAKNPGYNVYINIQGDEPFIEPDDINRLVACFEQADVDIATMVKPFDSTEDLLSANTVKVVLDVHRRAMYFSRSVIPFVRDESARENWLTNTQFYQHLGIYGFKREVLTAIANLDLVPLEKAESLEQLRWLSYGFNIYTAHSTSESICIDTPEDLEQVRKKMGW